MKIKVIKVNLTKLKDKSFIKYYLLKFKNKIYMLNQNSFNILLTQSFKSSTCLASNLDSFPLSLSI